MAIQFSSVVAAPAQGDGYPFVAHSVDVHKLGRFASPILMFEEGQVRGLHSPPTRTPGSRRSPTCSRTHQVNSGRGTHSVTTS